MRFGRVRHQLRRDESPGEIPAWPDATARPRFSVVIPAFNEQECIGACLTSLAAQDYPAAFEIIVVDNNCTDRTASIAAAAGATVVFEAERGVCQARQRGTEAARGEIIVSTDADTTFTPGWLSGIDRAFAQHPGAVAVAGPCRFTAAPWWGNPYSTVLFGLVALLKKTTGRVVYISATNIAFRKSAWSGYDTRLTQGGDELDLLRRLQRAGEVVFDTANPTHTSSRRLDQGLLYNITVTVLYYYLLGYALNRTFGRPVLGTAPPFRQTLDPARPRVGPPARLPRITGASWLIAAKMTTRADPGACATQPECSTINPREQEGT